MATNRIEQKGDEGEKAATPQNGSAVEKGGFLQNWLPVIVTIVAMPIFAYVTTMYVMLPKLEKSLGISAGSNASEGEKAESGGDEKGAKTKQSFQLNKVIVNVSGSAGTRYLLGSYTLVGTAPDFKSRLESHKDQLLDIAASIMSTKTISDLEKPGARNLIRNELISAFNNALGGAYVKEIYITEFAIQ